MAERRSLAEGLKIAPTAEASAEKEFVYGEKPKSPVFVQARVAINTRIRDDLARGLKRASLERKLEGVKPNTLQDILEEAVEPWLRTHGYL